MAPKTITTFRAVVSGKNAYVGWVRDADRRCLGLSDALLRLRDVILPLAVQLQGAECGKESAGFTRSRGVEAVEPCAEERRLSSQTLSRPWMASSVLYGATFLWPT